MYDPSHPRASVTEARRLFRDGEAVLVDVREADEFRAGHIPGALHIPLARLESVSAARHLGTAQRLVLVCRSGNRSRQAVALLAEHGVTAVDVIGGMRDWAAQGLPVADAHGAPGIVV
ncbi:rhodanese-like domain-containing protein [Streptomyces sp. NPDC046909]|uniref:rhodanese-like domain-containing protein n=1 Tax=Streptomyces sp. NPDC046909 TaxID=3155617 RepID=UPI0033D6A271